VAKLWICRDNASISSYSSWTEMTLEFPFQWGIQSSVFLHGVAGANRIIIESNPSSCRAYIKKSSLYSYDFSDSLFSKLESVSLFSSFVESLWPVRKCRFRHNQDIKDIILRPEHNFSGISLLHIEKTNLNI
ncbi:hypothetical protein MKX03_020816, partial [Papaver bracteatum]